MFPTESREIPDPELLAADAPLPEGEVLVLPAPSGQSISLYFAGPYEPFLRLDGARVNGSEQPDHAIAMRWLHRRLPGFYQALSWRYGLRGTMDPQGITVDDIYDFQKERFCDHAKIRQLMAACEVALLPFASLGRLFGASDLDERVRGLFATGSKIEVRVEEDGGVSHRKRSRVGR